MDEPPPVVADHGDSSQVRPPAQSSSLPPAHLLPLELRELSEDATWSLSSAKTGNGVRELRDGSLDTFWQSDGPAPHTVSIEFRRKSCVSEIRLLTSYKMDESYTPCHVSVRIGTNAQDAQEIQLFELKEPEGWIVLQLRAVAGQEHQNNMVVPLLGGDGAAGAGGSGDEDPLRGKLESDGVRTHFLQISVLSNHQNGRDTHVRGISLWGPRLPGGLVRSGALSFQTVAMTQFSTIR